MLTTRFFQLDKVAGADQLRDTIYSRVFDGEVVALCSEPASLELLVIDEYLCSIRRITAVLEIIHATVQKQCRFVRVEKDT